MIRYLSVVIVVLIVACTSQNEPSGNSPKIEQGKKIAGASFSALSEKLMTAMGNSGPEGAIAFCNLEAMPLTDSLSVHFNAIVKRSALKYRNAKNKPDSSELAALVTYSEELRLGIQPEPFIIKVNGKDRFIAPIPTKALCLSCHGIPGVNITESVSSKLNELYPEDMAIGFHEGDLRGIWSITFNN